MVISKQKKSQVVKGNRLLISITVIGSAGPIRLVVNEDDLVGDVIDTVLKSYARQGRLPVLGSNGNNFVLYYPLAESEALSPSETIGSFGIRNFMLCKKAQTDTAIVGKKSHTVSRNVAGSLKAWFHKSINLVISSH